MLETPQDILTLVSIKLLPGSRVLANEMTPNEMLFRILTFDNTPTYPNNNKMPSTHITYPISGDSQGQAFDAAPIFLFLKEFLKNDRHNVVLVANGPHIATVPMFGNGISQKHDVQGLFFVFGNGSQRLVEELYVHFGGSVPSDASSSWIIVVTVRRNGGYHGIPAVATDLREWLRHA